MSGILVFIEQRNGVIRKASTEALSEAHRLAATASWPVTAVVVGHHMTDNAAELGAYGASKVFVVEDEKLAIYSSEGYAAAVRVAIERCQPDAVFMPASILGRDLSGRLAARLGVGCLADVTKLHIDGGKVVAVRPIYSGKAMATVDGGVSKPVVVTLRPNVFPVQRSEKTAEVEILSTPPLTIRAVVKELLAKEAGELDVADADIIVAGGRGIKGEEYFQIIRDLAKALGAAVGASRAAVDAGWIDHAHQVGQTGKVVSPSLYVACGISGAIQHLAGMSSAKIIVAINKDPEAPIFKVADFGIIGDLFHILPPLTEEIRKLKSDN